MPGQIFRLFGKMSTFTKSHVISHWTNIQVCLRFIRSLRFIQVARFSSSTDANRGIFSFSQLLQSTADKRLFLCFDFVVTLLRAQDNVLFLADLCNDFKGEYCIIRPYTANIYLSDGEYIFI